MQRVALRGTSIGVTGHQNATKQVKSMQSGGEKNKKK